MSDVPDDAARPSRPDERNHPTVRRGSWFMRSQGVQLALVLAALGIILLVRSPSALSVAGAIGCFFGAGLAIFLGEKQVRSLRHEFRYEDEEPTG